MSTKGKAPSEGAASSRLIVTRGRARVRDASLKEAASASGAGREGGNVMEMQRRRLLLAIGEVVAEQGLEGASVGRVCERAGMSRRTFYELFEDREACFLAAFELAIERIADHVVAAYEGESRWRERVRAALTALLEYFDSEPGIARLCLVETLKAGPGVLERRRQLLEVLKAVIDNGRAAKDGAGPVPLAAEGIVGGVLSVIHARLLACSPLLTGRRRVVIGSASVGEHDRQPLLELRNPLMSMIVHPYLGAAAAERERHQPLPRRTAEVLMRSMSNGAGSDPFKDLPIRFTYRTARVLTAIAFQPEANNREVGAAAGVPDQGQMSKLLRRLQRNGLIENHASEQAKGEPNAWRLTPRGEAVQRTLGVRA
jgi:AcrR family transcriptional regulator/DNA-binding MarR family transcriptional regulator